MSEPVTIHVVALRDIWCDSGMVPSGTRGILVDFLPLTVLFDRGFNHMKVECRPCQAGAVNPANITFTGSTPKEAS